LGVVFPFLCNGESEKKFCFLKHVLRNIKATEQCRKESSCAWSLKIPDN